MVMYLDRRLAGSWFGAVVNVMESTDIDFLPDGWGWSTLDSVSGQLSVSRFRWSTPSAGVLRLRCFWEVGGESGREGFRTVEYADPSEEVIVARYALERRLHPLSGEYGPALVVDPAIAYESVFYRGVGMPTAADDPSAAAVPYPPEPRPAAPRR
ncbi:hypothetical protein [Streptomyces sp. NRRL F-5727]|uniref:hypothetical protein n=1 Tax=Streptomyces sp. NRRL F-5727 TaxID=1463871 RepID=UPI0004CA48BA|nr:hypothetical protein [Streptomyces sp. NRRL F-5727]